MYYHDFYTVNPFKPKSIEFDVWSEQDIKKLSVAKIHTFIPFDALGYPIPSGPYDPRLGPLKFNSDPCATCGNNLMKCAGHYGHIELPLPVFNPLFTPIVANILKASCLNCFSVLIPGNEKCVLIAQLKLIDEGCLIQAQELDQYLEEKGYKQLWQIREDMEKICEEAKALSAGCLCKNADDLWKHYVGKIFERSKATKMCFHCKKPLIKVKYHRGRLLLDGKKQTTFLMPMEVKEYLRNLWRNDRDLLQVAMKVISQSNVEYPTDICFTTAVLVTPSNTRPVQIVRQKPVEHPKNSMYRLILQDCLQIQSILQIMNKDKTNEVINKEVEDVVAACRGDTINDKLHNAWYSLQVSVNSMLDADALKALVNISVGASRIGLKQLMEKKAGILRKNMMGKRVDYFARSVVTPDPLLNINEIGVPEAFAKKLTFPVPVTPWNVTELRKMVLNGPQMYPGANIVEADDGSVVWISGTNAEARASLAKTLLTPRVDSCGPKVVHRHLRDGDMLLINRQPSLHKPSIMAHKARVLKGEKTFRLHYANCKAYNADFDGDEMNAHFPQGELARAEASEIVNASNQYLVPRDGTPLSGLIQDHVIAGFRLSIRDRFFDRLQYHQMVFQALCFLVDDIKLLPPTILKPQRLWTGKQVISTLIINLTPEDNVPLNTTSKTKISFNSWPLAQKDCDYMTMDERKYMSETNVIIRRGELLSGIIDKNHVGATHCGLVHNFYELYGGEHSANLLSAFSKLFTFYQQTHGFTLGVSDILVKSKPDRKRRKIMKTTEMAGITAAMKALDIPPAQDTDEEALRKQLEIAYKKSPNFRALNDREYKTMLDQVTNEINKVCLPLGLLQSFPDNNLQLMVQSGAKGSTVNTMQISCLLGQIELEGKRPPLMISGKSLPSFRPYDPSPIAGGFIASRFMTGIRPQEFYFHCMAGREGLIDTAVKTSRSGYLQRCLVKLMEGLIVNYDLTVRDSDNSVVQFQYGEDGLDILKSQMLKPDQLRFFCENIDAFCSKKEMKSLRCDTAEKQIKERKKAISAFKKEHENEAKSSCRSSAFLTFCNEIAKDPPGPWVDKALPGRTLQATNLCHLWHSLLHDETKKTYTSRHPRCPDPVMADFKPDVHFGSVSEIVENMVDKYIEENKENLPFKKSKFKNVVYWKTFKSLCQPGEAVGVLAAQSVGEPSTQMTLNTFHFAGRGEMNVTLGIPRLREILMVASKRIKTPSMEIPFKTDVPKLEKKAEKLRKSLTRIVLKDVLEKIDVKEWLQLGGQKTRVYELHLHYLPRKAYSQLTNVRPQQILNYVETNFLMLLGQMLKKNLKTSYGGDLVLGNKPAGATMTGNQSEEEGVEETSEKTVRENQLDDDDSEEDSDTGGDGDATDAKRRNQRVDTQDYDDENDNDEESDKLNETVLRKKLARSSDNTDNDSDDDDEADRTAEVKTPHVSDDSTNSDDDEDNTISIEDIFNSSFGSKAKKGVHLAEKYGVKNVKHDQVNMSWSKILLWVSLSYKRLDLSDLLPTLADNAVIHEVPGIKRAITYTNSEGLLTLKTEGSYGIGELFKHDRLLNLNKLYSNDVHAVAQTYGIEAANRVILREVQDVFKVYGITVDPRHLLLIADYMTFGGYYQPLNRTGMDNCPSPLQQMTFESTLKYLKNATVRKLKDNLQSPSSSLIVGQESKIGSGLVSLHCR